jgi:hypothetical protein
VHVYREDGGDHLLVFGGGNLVSDLAAALAELPGERMLMDLSAAWYCEPLPAAAGTSRMASTPRSSQCGEPIHLTCLSWPTYRRQPRNLTICDPPGGNALRL